MRHRAAVFLLGITALTDGNARADVESPLVKQAIAAADELDYPRAVALLEQALSETLTRDEMIATHRTLALCHVALDQPDQARDDLEALLRLDPGFAIDRSVSPRLRALLDEARAKIAEHEDPAAAREAPLPSLSVEVDPPRPFAGEPLSLRAIYPGGIAARLQLFYRAAGQPSFRWMTARPREDGRFEVRFPATEVTTPGLEFYLALQDELGAPLVGAGTAGDPLTVEVRPIPRAPIYQRRWFVCAIAGLVAAALIATVVGSLFAARADQTSVTIVPR